MSDHADHCDLVLYGAMCTCRIISAAQAATDPEDDYYEDYHDTDEWPEQEEKLY
jgi:hypothetical protein